MHRYATDPALARMIQISSGFTSSDRKCFSHWFYLLHILLMQGPLTSSIHTHILYTGVNKTTQIRMLFCLNV